MKGDHIYHQINECLEIGCAVFLLKLPMYHIYIFVLEIPYTRVSYEINRDDGHVLSKQSPD